MARTRKKKNASRWKAALREQLPIPGTCALIWALGLLEPWLWFGAMVKELAFHFALALLAGCLVAAFRRRLLMAAGLAAVGALFAAPLAPLYQARRPTPASGPLIRVAVAHLGGQPVDAQALQGWLARERPDALALTGLERPLPDTRVGAYRVESSAASKVLLLVPSGLLASQSQAGPVPAVSLRAGRCQARLIGLELPALTSYTSLGERARRIERATALPSPPRSIWLAQLGSRPQAADLRALLDAHNLRDARVAHGRFASAPASLGPLGLPRSHVLVHGWIGVREVATAAPLVEGGQRVLTASLELTEPRCRLPPRSASE